MQKQGLNFRLNTKVSHVKRSGERVSVGLLNSDGKSEEVRNALIQIDSDVVLVGVGRRPNTDGLGLENIGLKMDSHGRIVVDKNFKTSIASIRAIGDVVTGPMLAHKAEDEAVAAVAMIKNMNAHVDYLSIPSVIYTHPEVSWCGYGEEELKSKGINYTLGYFPLMANSRARANRNNLNFYSLVDTDGYVKVFVENESGALLGCQIVGSNAGEMISEAVVAMSSKISVKQLAHTSHAHPVYNSFNKSTI